ncbi:MAG: 4-alpha-glucanotransferase, partial [Acidimicrobiia bacterium]
VDPDGKTTRVIVTPGDCHLPSDLSTWGWAVQLYAARSRESWGIGDLADLGALARWSAGQGAGMMLVNPLHAALPLEDGQQPSPYFPSSRAFRNPIYLRVEGEPPDAVAALNDDRRIDRNAVYKLKMEALALQWRRFCDAGGDERFEAFRRELGASLEAYATFCALTETHGVDWRTWPEAVRTPTSPGVAPFAADGADRISFHAWLQWLLDLQLAEAGEQVGMVQDLAIGCDPAGADAWMWQDAFAEGFSVGAPPDEFNQAGQDWGLPPFDPWKLRSAAYQPFIETVRAGFRHAGGLRFDHVMGLFRLYWIPRDAEGGAVDGAYVRYPSSDLLDILALESVRAGGWVVGEDLGTVQDEVRAALRERNVLSYKLLWFESQPPREWPEQAFGAITTHDLPTIAGLWTGSDLERQRDAGVEPNEESTEELRSKVQRWTGIDDDAPVDEVVERAHGLLAEAPCRVVTATVEDALCVEERPNQPGTTVESNWSIALPVTIEVLMETERAAHIARTLDSRSG